MLEDANSDLCWRRRGISNRAEENPYAMETNREAVDEGDRSAAEVEAGLAG